MPAALRTAETGTFRVGSGGTRRERSRRPGGRVSFILLSAAAHSASANTIQASGWPREALEVDGLLDVAVDAQVVAGGEVGFLIRRGEDYDGHAAGARVGPNRPQNLQARHFGQMQIQQRHARQSG